MKLFSTLIPAVAKIGFLLLILTLNKSTAFSQNANIPESFTKQINAELEKRGLNEAEVRTRLFERGIDIEKIPTSDLPQYKERVTRILDEFEKEKNAALENESKPIEIKNSASKSKQTDIDITKAKNEVTKNALSIIENTDNDFPSNQEKALKTKIEPKLDSIRATLVYGHSLFQNHTLDAYTHFDASQVPETYTLGEGDELRITIFGASQADIVQKINAAGFIQPAGVAKIFLKGLSLAQARSVIFDRLSSSYLFSSDQFAVTLNASRTLLVSVFGEVNNSGGFQLPAVNSALNAIAIAGGPTNIGTVREIQLIRGTTRKKIDLYAFMKDPLAQAGFDLQNNDIVFVPVSRLIVSIEGGVNRPMKYEMLQNETLTDLLEYAGGVSEKVAPENIIVKRYINGEVQLFEFNYDEIKSGKTKIQLLNGDQITLKTINKSLEKFVEINGSVFYAGRYDLSTNPTVKKLLKKAQPNTQARTDIIFLERQRADSTYEIIMLPFPKDDNVPDFNLQKKDKLLVLNQKDYRDLDTLQVSGQVRQPFKKFFSLTDHITVKEAIEIAGGLKSTAYPIAYIFRKNVLNPAKREYIRVELSKADQVHLQAGDNLNIYDNTTYTNEGDIQIFGAVKNPSKYTYSPTLNIEYLIESSGGLTVGAATNRVEVFRTNLSSTERISIEMIRLTIDSLYQVVEPKDFVLQPYDQVVVRMTPEFTIARTLEINGQVMYPGVYAIESKQIHLSDIIIRAGGLLPAADPTGSRLFRTYRKRGDIGMDIAKAIRNPKKVKFDPILFEGDIININRLENTVTIRAKATRMEEYASTLNEVQFIVGQEKMRTDEKVIIYQGCRSAAWYIRNYAGGFQKRADLNSVTVTLPNGQMHSTEKIMWLFRKYPKVEHGGTVAVQMKPEKDEKKKTESGTKWEDTLMKTLSLATSILTITIMAKTLK